MHFHDLINIQLYTNAKTNYEKNWNLMKILKTINEVKKKYYFYILYGDLFSTCLQKKKNK